MSLDTYDNLKAELADWLDDDDLTSQIVTFIQLAESLHRQELRVREMKFRYDTDQLVAGDRYLALPSNYIAMRQLRLFDGTTVHRLSETSDEEITRRYSTTRDTPQWFTEDGEIEFERPIDKAYTAELKYWGWVTPLSASNQTNGILTRAPDAYLWGSLRAAMPWLTDDPRLPTIEAGWTGVRDALNQADVNKGGALVSRVRGKTR